MQTKLKPNAEGLIGVGVHFERIRRVTGYLVGTLDRFNDGKRAEERDRVKHMHVWYTLDVVITTVQFSCFSRFIPVILLLANLIRMAGFFYSSIRYLLNSVLLSKRIKAFSAKSLGTGS